MPQNRASLRTVQAKAAEWSEEFLECRTYNHTWRPLRATWNSRYRYYYIVQLCPRCLSERHAEISESGHVYSQWLKYADGYLLEGMGRITGEGRDVLRLAAITRTFDLEKLTPKEAKETRPHSKTTRLETGLEESA